MELHQFSGLNGIRRGRAKGVMVNSVTGFMSALRKHRVATDAGDHGAITVWRDDAGNYQGAFTRWHSTIDHKGFPTKTALRKWLVEWFPKMREPQP
jgi:hypothetical protein